METLKKENETQEEKKEVRPRYVVGLRYAWAGHAKSKKEAEMFARQEFMKKLKDIENLRMSTEIVEVIHDV